MCALGLLLDLNVAHFIINFIIPLQQYIMNTGQGFEYVSGSGQLLGFAKTAACCGELVGGCKAWLPCLGCFCCCCENPYISVPQGSKGLVLSFSRYERTCDSGLHYINPITQEIILVDCRISVINIPMQSLMTRDNISIKVDSCLYYHIKHPHLTKFRVDSLESSLIKIAGGMIKNTVAAFTFQNLLEKKTEISQDIKTELQPIIKNWGIEIDNVCLKNFGISKDLEAQLVSAPIARRNAESKIIAARGQVQIAKLLSQKSKILDSKTAIQIRYLETLKGLGRNQNSRFIYRSQ